MEVRDALNQLVASEVLTPSDLRRFLFSAISAFQENNGNSQLDVQIGSNGRAMCDAQCEYDVPGERYSHYPGDIERAEHIDDVLTGGARRAFL